MLLLGIDFETTWTEPVSPMLARPTEVGAVLYDTEDRKPKRIYSALVCDGDYPPSPEALVKLTGITDQMLKDHGIGPASMLDSLNDLICECDYMVGHNGIEFDKVIYEQECDRWAMRTVDKPWIDTKTDVPYPEEIKTRKLTYLAAEHGFANPFSHRALFDVLTMLNIMERYDFDEIIKLSHEPNVKVIASVSFKDKDLAKKRGYYWDGEEKIWAKVMKAKQAEKEKAEAPFPTQVLTNL
jgi:DNA polymerase III epsilon subunit-like protein